MADRTVLLDQYVPGARALVPGADNTDAVNAALTKIAADSGNGITTVAVQGNVTHDRTIVLTRATSVRLAPRRPGDGFQTLTDTGGLEPRAARIRAHLSIDRCQDSGICNLLDIGGTHPETGPNSSPDIPEGDRIPGDPFRDVWEGQSAVRIQGSSGTVVQGNLHHVWGDFVESQPLIPRAGEYYGNRDTLIMGGKWHRNGRVGLKCHATRGLHWYETEISKCVGEKFHIESGSNPAGDQEELYVERLVLDGFGRNLVGVSGGARVDGLYVGNIVKIGGCLQVGVNGPARLPDGSAKYTRFRFWNWRWNEREDGGVIAGFSHVDGLDYTGCAGPVRKTVQPSLQFRTNDCRDAHVDLSQITRV